MKCKPIFKCSLIVTPFQHRYDRYFRSAANDEISHFLEHIALDTYPPGLATDLCLSYMRIKTYA